MRYPNALSGLLGLGGGRLNALVKAAGLGVEGVHPSPGARAALLRDRLAEPGILRRYLEAGDYDVLAGRLGMGRRAGWGDGFEDAVFARLFAEAKEPAVAGLRRSSRDVGRAGEWLELGGAEAAVGSDGCLRLRVAGRVWVVIPGGTFAMGLSEAEQRALAGGSEEIRAHVREMGELARPVHTVEIAPFLCAEEPEWADGVCLFDGSAALEHAARAGARLLTEAEWEYVARTVPGVRGLGWGTWVEDGWHPNYVGAPVDGAAWEPREVLETVRGGALLSAPWQEEGERLLLHPAHRERKGGGVFPLLLARDLPVREGR